ncbi:MAG TPA: NADP-dependent oxidoreductase [Steroidobacteraceae bacterium]|jgi:NADPH-dependent curcumin reductase CurA|nr:NADP-dependent oxidoreductase [Steroidobacteraceae bacterium]
MPQSGAVNRRVTLHSRPVGAPMTENFRIDEVSIPEPGPGQVLLRTLFLSLDPYMRARMSDAPSYAAPVAVGGVMVGGTIACVQASRHPDFQPGQRVVSANGWQDYAVSDGAGLRALDPGMTHASWGLGALGMPGFTAYMGLLDIGQPRPGETVVVAAASGAVGSIVGQIARLKGCRTVGIAGGSDKCRYVRDELGFDECLDRRQPDLAAKLQAACPQGIDIYFENVGGAVFDAVLPLLNMHARVPVCGLIARYNDRELPPGPDRLGLLARTLLMKRIKMQGFIISDYASRFQEFIGPMSRWVADGAIKFREDIVEGLENAPTAFIGLLEGRNFGKLIVRIARE